MTKRNISRPSTRERRSRRDKILPPIDLSQTPPSPQRPSSSFESIPSNPLPISGSPYSDDGHYPSKIHGTPIVPSPPAIPRKNPPRPSTAFSQPISTDPSRRMAQPVESGTEDLGADLQEQLRQLQEYRETGAKVMEIEREKLYSRGGSEVRKSGRFCDSVLSLSVSKERRGEEELMEFDEFDENQRPGLLFADRFDTFEEDDYPDSPCQKKGESDGGVIGSGLEEEGEIVQSKPSISLSSLLTTRLDSLLTFPFLKEGSVLDISMAEAIRSKLRSACQIIVEIIHKKRREMQELTDLDQKGLQDDISSDIIVEKDEKKFIVQLANLYCHSDISILYDLLTKETRESFYKRLLFSYEEIGKCLKMASKAKHISKTKAKSSVRTDLNSVRFLSYHLHLMYLLSFDNYSHLSRLNAFLYSYSKNRDNIPPIYNLKLEFPVIFSLSNDYSLAPIIDMIKMFVLIGHQCLMVLPGFEPATYDSGRKGEREEKEETEEYKDHDKLTDIGSLRAKISHNFSLLPSNVQSAFKQAVSELTVAKQLEEDQRREEERIEMEEYYQESEEQAGEEERERGHVKFDDLDISKLYNAVLGAIIGDIETTFFDVYIFGNACIKTIATFSQQSLGYITHLDLLHFSYDGNMVCLSKEKDHDGYPHVIKEEEEEEEYLIGTSIDSGLGGRNNSMNGNNSNSNSSGNTTNTNTSDAFSASSLPSLLVSSFLLLSFLSHLPLSVECERISALSNQLLHICRILCEITPNVGKKLALTNPISIYIPYSSSGPVLSLQSSPPTQPQCISSSFFAIHFPNNTIFREICHLLNSNSICSHLPAVVSLCGRVLSKAADLDPNVCNYLTLDGIVDGLVVAISRASARPLRHFHSLTSKRTSKQVIPPAVLTDITCLIRLLFVCNVCASNVSTCEGSRKELREKEKRDQQKERERREKEDKRKQKSKYYSSNFDEEEEEKEEEGGKRVLTGQSDSSDFMYSSSDDDDTDFLHVDSDINAVQHEQCEVPCGQFFANRLCEGSLGRLIDFLEIILVTPSEDESVFELLAHVHPSIVEFLVRLAHLLAISTIHASSSRRLMQRLGKRGKECISKAFLVLSKLVMEEQQKKVEEGKKQRLLTVGKEEKEEGEKEEVGINNNGINNEKNWLKLSSMLIPMASFVANLCYADRHHASSHPILNPTAARNTTTAAMHIFLASLHILHELDATIKQEVTADTDISNKLSSSSQNLKIVSSSHGMSSSDEETIDKSILPPSSSMDKDKEDIQDIDRRKAQALTEVLALDLEIIRLLSELPLSVHPSTLPSLFTEGCVSGIVCMLELAPRLLQVELIGCIVSITAAAAGLEEEEEEEHEFEGQESEISESGTVRGSGAGVNTNTLGMILKKCKTYETCVNVFLNVSFDVFSGNPTSNGMIGMTLLSLLIQAMLNLLTFEFCTGHGSFKKNILCTRCVRCANESDHVDGDSVMLKDLIHQLLAELGEERMLR
ncbi:hypothetical protein ADUPG1_013322 [Aduncisulcus paluster]|uniref:Uncharacterized protein n=1 Tax=Aduncisulcus paluster TaxID=2918883 RepID=A0ABQ5K2I2_9EUKA|nr:hypothetical protein ADUPG1_013322 [Aduncisulcus paluster]